ncbi:glycoside hydrolase family 15 protein [Geomonas sp. RF6]|uniref:glycoside hydrolase family 15 protein n=1 Tax=Geomonas sp. RF6 TaxID=2897342 RepID=UPI001E64D821|nr:glycoside hydrolase family 15 protein [Geomonas sp. RF6]UFS70696.1 glycoside hydrolase family 15 protein [Geomonas sp. RF6]
MDESWKAIKRHDGYLPIEDHGLVGDGDTAALVGADGAISWLCVPRFDSDPLFAAILDATHGGSFILTLEDAVESRQYYLEESGVLITELRGASGTIRITDALTLRSGADLSEDVAAGRCELIRRVEVLQGNPQIRVSVAPRGGGAVEGGGGACRIRWALQPHLNLHLFSPEMHGLSSSYSAREGERFHLILRWGEGSSRHGSGAPETLIEETLRAWRRWIAGFNYQGPQEMLVRRSAITIKLLDYLPTGALVAAATSSLPERVGGARNWDYRYAWVRDTALCVYALRRIGMTKTAAGFLTWVLDAIEKDGRPRVLYNLHGEQPPLERIDPSLEGYRRSAPVRWGNAAADQRQHDVYGEIIDCAYQWARGGGRIDSHLWSRLHALVEGAREAWRIPDQGIWEVRTSGRPFTYSAALCHVALERGARMATELGFPGDAAGWLSEAETIRSTILEDAWDPEKQALTEHLGGGALDASLLVLPMRRVLRADHPRMVATTAAVARHLDAGNGLLYRYLPRVSPDGLPGEEGAFLLCSFWLADNLAQQGRLDEAHALYDSLCGRANRLGLLPEEIDPASGAFLGNFPQAFSHVGLISSGVLLSRRDREGRKR